MRKVISLSIVVLSTLLIDIMPGYAGESAVSTMAGIMIGLKHYPGDADQQALTSKWDVSAARAEIVRRRSGKSLITSCCSQRPLPGVTIAVKPMSSEMVSTRSTGEGAGATVELK